MGLEWLKRCRYDLFATIATGLSVNAHEKMLCGAWHGRNSDKWSQMSNAPSTQSGNLEVDEENREGCARLDEPPVEVNTQAAIRLLRQHFSTGQSDHAAEVSHVLGTISRLNEGQRPVGGGQVLSANDTGATTQKPAEWLHCCRCANRSATNS